MIKYSLYFSLFFCFACSHTFLRKQESEHRNINQKQRHLELGRPYALKESEQMEWHLKITKTQKAWQMSKGNKNITVAIIDTGIDLKHPDLKDNLWVNQVEKNGKKRGG